MTKYEQQYRKLRDQCRHMQEENACSVIALAIVADCEFDTALHSLVRHGRKLGQGTLMVNVLKALERDFGITMECMSILSEESACAALDKYVGYGDIGIVEVEEHVFAYKYGEVIDSKSNMAQRPLYLFRIVKPRETAQ